MRKNLSQQKLLEILCSEIEILQQTTRNIKEVAPEIEKQLAELKNTKLKQGEYILQRKLKVPQKFV